MPKFSQEMFDAGSPQFSVETLDRTIGVVPRLRSIPIADPARPFVDLHAQLSAPFQEDLSKCF